MATGDFQNVKVLLDNENMFNNENNFPIDGELDKNEKISNLKDVTDRIANPQNKDQIISIQTMIVILITKNILKCKIL